MSLNQGVKELAVGESESVTFGRKVENHSGLHPGERGEESSPGSRKKASSSAFDTHLMSLTSLGLGSTLGSSAKKRM